MIVCVCVCVCVCMCVNIQVVVSLSSPRIRPHCSLIPRSPITLVIIAHLSVHNQTHTRFNWVSGHSVSLSFSSLFVCVPMCGWLWDWEWVSLCVWTKKKRLVTPCTIPFFPPMSSSSLCDCVPRTIHPQTNTLTHSHPLILSVLTSFARPTLSLTPLPSLSCSHFDNFDNLTRYFIFTLTLDPFFNVSFSLPCSSFFFLPFLFLIFFFLSYFFFFLSSSSFLSFILLSSLRSMLLILVSYPSLVLSL